MLIVLCWPNFQIPITMSSVSFFDLPAELRVNIYEMILADTPDISNTDKEVAPTSIRLNNYRGIILASKEVKREFEHEWVKAFNAWLLKVANRAELQATILPPNAALRDARQVHFHFPASTNTTDRGLMSLVANLHSFTLRPDATFPVDDTTLRGFFRSAKLREFGRLYESLVNCYIVARKAKMIPQNQTCRHSMSYWSIQPLPSRSQLTPASQTKK
jgi:hypothetical protein